MSKTKTTPCLSDELLERFLAERLSEADEATAQAHLEHCSTCQGRLERVAGDPTVWSGVREHLADGAALDQLPAEWEVGDADAALRELRNVLHPTDDPQMMGRIGPYEVCGLIGRGTTGLVVKAREPRLDRFVAIKLMAPRYSSNGSARQRFEREARAIAAVSHDHVVPIHAVDDHAGLPYIVMKYVAGVSLEQRLAARGPLDVCEAVRVGLQVAQGLAAAHAQGIVHRDVKPANVILENTVERAMVTDFGLARVTDEASMTRSGTITGTPQYMSPEQARGDGVDARSDLFSLGSLMYAACAGRPPFRAETLFGVLHRVTNTEPRALREVNPRVDAWLEELIAKLMAKAPEERFQTADAVAEALEAELAHLQNPTAVEAPARAWRRSVEGGGKRRGRLVAMLLGGAAAALGAFAVLELRDGGEGEASRAALGLGWASTPEEGDPWSVTWSSVAGQADRFRQELSRTFPVDGPGTLRVRIDLGDVEVVPSQDGSIQLAVQRLLDAEGLEQARQAARSHQLDVRHAGNDLTLDAIYAGNEASLVNIGGVQYRIAVPRGSQVEVETANGSIDVQTEAQSITARSNGGDIAVAKVNGSVFARSRDGAVRALAGCETADIIANGGDVWLRGVTQDAKAFSSGGSIHLGSSPGEVYAQTSGGDIEVLGALGSVAAHSSGGNVRARLTESPTEHLSLSAARGNVDVFVDEEVAATFGARGSVESALEFAPNDEIASDGKTWDVCLLNGGGGKVQLESTSGLITVASMDAGESEALFSPELRASASADFDASAFATRPEASARATGRSPSATATAPATGGGGTRPYGLRGSASASSGGASASAGAGTGTGTGTGGARASAKAPSADRSSVKGRSGLGGSSSSPRSGLGGSGRSGGRSGLGGSGTSGGLSGTGSGGTSGGRSGLGGSASSSASPSSDGGGSVRASVPLTAYARAKTSGPAATRRARHAGGRQPRRPDRRLHALPADLARGSRGALSRHRLPLGRFQRRWSDRQRERLGHDAPAARRERSLEPAQPPAARRVHRALAAHHPRQLPRRAAAHGADPRRRACRVPRRRGPRLPHGLEPRRPRKLALARASARHLRRNGAGRRTRGPRRGSAQPGLARGLGRPQRERRRGTVRGRARVDAGGRGSDGERVPAPAALAGAGLELPRAALRLHLVPGRWPRRVDRSVPQRGVLPLAARTATPQRNHGSLGRTRGVSRAVSLSGGWLPGTGSAYRTWQTPRWTARAQSSSPGT